MVNIGRILGIVGIVTSLLFIFVFSQASFGLVLLVSSVVVAIFAGRNDFRIVWKCFNWNVFWSIFGDLLFIASVLVVYKLYSPWTQKIGVMAQQFSKISALNNPESALALAQGALTNIIAYFVSLVLIVALLFVLSRTICWFRIGRRSFKSQLWIEVKWNVLMLLGFVIVVLFRSPVNAVFFVLWLLACLIFGVYYQSLNKFLPNKKIIAPLGYAVFFFSVLMLLTIPLKSYPKIAGVIYLLYFGVARVYLGSVVR